jgi:enoyl-CoA hydratase/carnithine racemase
VTDSGKTTAGARVLTDETEPHVAVVTLNRPDKHNALDWAGWSDLADAFAALARRSDIRCILVRGAGGKAFCTGADIAEFPRLRRTRTQAIAYGKLVETCWERLLACPQPIVAEIDGLCVGGGLELACLADIRLASAGSRFGMPLKRLGAVLAYPELQPILQVVGPANMLEILLEGWIFGTDDATRMGLLSRVVPKDEIAAAGMAVARSIAAGAPLSARTHKRFIRRLSPMPALDPAELAEAFDCFDTEDFATGFSAFLDKKDPVFRGR